MNRIIINNKTALSDLVCLHLVSKVVEMGRISENDTNYCFASTFVHTATTKSIAVYAIKNAKSDSFTIEYCSND